jgi:hypothetical protein
MPTGSSCWRALRVGTARMGEVHEVAVHCDCDDIERCVMELYVSDVRIAFDEIDRLSKQLEQMPEMAI